MEDGPIDLDKATANLEKFIKFKLAVASQLTTAIEAVGWILGEATELRRQGILSQDCAQWLNFDHNPMI